MGVLKKGGQLKSPHWECGMSDHVDIQPQTTVTPIPSPEHVISVPLDIEENETSERNNSTQNHDELPFSTETLSREE